MKMALLDGKPEVFYSIQGEGASIGTPAIFVRLGLCNLHCVWCDTDYTWNHKNTCFTHQLDAVRGFKIPREQGVGEFRIEQIAELIKAKQPCRRVIFTGGEPLLQQEALLELCRMLPGYIFEVETNGTRIVTPALDSCINQYNVSAKLSNSNNPDHLRIVPQALEFYATNKRAWFKFVVSTQEDLDEILALQQLYKLPRHKILLMPEATTREQLESRRPWLIDACLQQNLRYSDRLHIAVWDNKKGV